MAYNGWSVFGSNSVKFVSRLGFFALIAEYWRSGSLFILMRFAGSLSRIESRNARNWPATASCTDKINCLLRI